MTTTNIPSPQGYYAPAKRHGDLIFVSGMTPRSNGCLLYTGQMSANAPLECCKPAAELATANALNAARALLKNGEELAAAINLTVYVNAAPGFAAHSGIADYASRLVADSFDGDIPSRAAIGASSLPGDALLEVTLIVAVNSNTHGRFRARSRAKL